MLVAYKTPHHQDLEYFLGIKVKHLPNGSLLLCQTKYICDLLDKAEMTNVKGVSTPLQGGLELSNYDFDYIDDLALYISIMGALQKIIVTRPEIGIVCQFMYQPLFDHWKVVKCILHHLKGTLSHGLHLQLAPSPTSILLLPFVMLTRPQILMTEDQLQMFVYILVKVSFLGGLRNKKQTLVAQSSAKVECRSLVITLSEILWLQYLLKELKIVYATLVIYCDN